MELRRYLTILRRRVWLIVITVIVGMIAGWGLSPREKVYGAEATIYVGARQYGANVLDVSGDRLAGIERLAGTYATMLASLPIAQDALALTGVDRSAKDVVEQTKPQLLFGTQLVKVAFYDEDPTVAKQMADGLAEALVNKVQIYEPSAIPGEGDVPALPAYVFSRADLPTEPLPSGLMRNLILGGLFGFVAAAGVVFLLEYLDITIRSVEDAERRLELPVLGVIPVRESNRRVDALLGAARQNAAPPSTQPLTPSPVG